MVLCLEGDVDQILPDNHSVLQSEGTSDHDDGGEGEAGEQEQQEEEEGRRGARW